MTPSQKSGIACMETQAQRRLNDAPLPGALSPFYPGFVVGDPSAARSLFLGVDQPSYHAHIIMATPEYRF